MGRALAPRLLLLLAAAAAAAGQGLDRSLRGQLGANLVQQSAQAVYKLSADLKKQYKVRELPRH